MPGRYVFIPDPREVREVERIELFAGMKDVNTVPEVAEAFGVSNQTIYNLIKSGALACFHIGSAVRVSKTAMLAYITEQEATA